MEMAAEMQKPTMNGAVRSDMSLPYPKATARLSFEGVAAGVAAGVSSQQDSMAAVGGSGVSQQDSTSAGVGGQQLLAASGAGGSGTSGSQQEVVGSGSTSGVQQLQIDEVGMSRDFHIIRQLAREGRKSVQIFSSKKKRQNFEEFRTLIKN